MSLSDRLSRGSNPTVTNPVQSPVWKGPAEDGITYSLLSRFLCCRERFRLLVIEGLKLVDSFNHRLVFGEMWHLCEEFHSQGVSWEEPLEDFAVLVGRRYPTSGQQVDHWYNVVRVTFPIYLDYWASHEESSLRTPLLYEQVFDVPYHLPSGRVVRLRGRWDGVDLLGSGHSACYLREHKTKGQVDEGQIKRQLFFDLQTMLYLVALHWTNDHDVEGGGIHDTGSRHCRFGSPIHGVIYNVIRRPLSGGKGSLVRHKATKTRPEESRESFYARVAAYVRAEPETYFMRWKCEVTPADVDRFRHECLDSVLEQLCDWWEWVSDKRNFGPHGYRSAFSHYCHWRHPFGVFNILDEGGSSDLDEYLATGSEVGLERCEKLFSELE